jgi:aminomethyltransferase
MAVLKSPLYDWHSGHNGKLVEFGGWAMPLTYGSILEEHHSVRKRVGLFDISHMGRLTFQGPAAREWLESVTTNAVGKLAPGQIQYSLMTHEQAGIIDDVLVYASELDFKMVCNAANRGAVLEQLHRHKPGGEANLSDRTESTAMFAIQGPRAADTLEPLVAEPRGVLMQPLRDIGYYHGTMGKIAGAECVLSRTGYTGEDGFEVMLGAGEAVAVWEAILDSGKTFGIAPCGLGARDTLRLEAGMPLYGHELSLDIDPYSAGLGSFVKLEKGEFVGREALRAAKAGSYLRRVGLILEGKRVARQGAAIRHEGRTVGQVTSGTYSPTLERPIAMGYIERALATPGTALEVDVRGEAISANLVKLPFYARAR